MSKLDALDEKLDRSLLIQESLQKGEQELKKLNELKEEKERVATEHVNRDNKEKVEDKKSRAINNHLLLKNLKQERASITYYLYKHLDAELERLVIEQTQYAKEANQNIREITKGQILEMILENYFEQK